VAVCVLVALSLGVLVTMGWGLGSCTLVVFASGVTDGVEGVLLAGG
jgi:hypothetical protein